jgi:DNA polymerase-4
MAAYSEASRAVFDVFRDTTPLVEGISIDEAFLDVGGLGRVSGPPEAIAARLREEVRDRVGLPITVGVAPTKFLAKVASGVAKPDGLLVVPPGRELAFLHPLPVERVWGVGAVTAGKLHGRGIRTVGELAAAPVELLVGLLGSAAGRHLHALAHNRDERRVRTGVRRRSIGAQRALGRGGDDSAVRDAALVGLVDRVTRRMRESGRVGRTVVLRVRFADFSRASRAHTVGQPTAETGTVLRVARRLLGGLEPELAARGCTLVGLSVATLADGDAVQLVLPFARRSPTDLDDALDDVRRRFGTASVTRGVLLRHGEGLAVPVLPD